MLVRRLCYVGYGVGKGFRLPLGAV